LIAQLSHRVWVSALSPCPVLWGVAARGLGGRDLAEDALAPAGGEGDQGASALVSDHPSVRRTAGDEHEPARTRDELLFVDREAILALEHPIELLVLIVHMEPNACIRRSGGLDDAERPIGLVGWTEDARAATDLQGA